MYNVFCIKWGEKYTSDYVNRLFNMVKRNTTLPFRFICLTDNDKGISDEIEIRPLPRDDLDYYWNKLQLFGDLRGITGTGIYFDLDIIIINNIDDIFLQKGDFVSIDEQAMGIPDARTYNTSIIKWEIGKCNHIINEFDRGISEGWLKKIENWSPTFKTIYYDVRLDEIPNHNEQIIITEGILYRGDQEWTTARTYPNGNHVKHSFPKSWCSSYKALVTACQGTNKKTTPLSDNKAIIFHGFPKPTQILGIESKENESNLPWRAEFDLERNRWIEEHWK